MKIFCHPFPLLGPHPTRADHSIGGFQRDAWLGSAASLRAIMENEEYVKLSFCWVLFWRSEFRMLLMVPHLRRRPGQSL